MNIKESKFFIIGAGKVGNAIGQLLKMKKLKVAGVLDTHRDRTSKLAKKLGAGNYYNRWNEIGDAADVIIICVPDDAISDVTAKLVKEKVARAGMFICHTSGVHDSGILDPLKKLGCTTFSIHPLLSITDPEGLMMIIEDAFFALEGDSEGIELGVKIAEAFGARYFTVQPEKKPLYHAAASILSNSMPTLFALSMSILLHVGIEPDDAQEALSTLLGSTFINLAKSEPAETFTGPVSRGDIETIKKHLKALSEYDDEDVKSLYIKLGKITLEFADIIGIDKKKLAIIEKEFNAQDR